MAEHNNSGGGHHEVRRVQFCLLVLVFPAVILHARRLHDMGHTAWLLLAPGALMVVAFGIWLGIVSFGAQFDSAVPMIALAISAGFALWGCIARRKAEANSFGAPAAP